MKKWSMLILFALALLAAPSAWAQDLPDFIGAVTEGFGQGLREGAAALSARQELTLELSAGDVRIEEGQTLLLTLRAGNPYPQKIPVTLTLSLPDRLSCAQPLTWEAELDAASVDPATGQSVPGEAVFTREVTLAGGGGNTQAVLEAEMRMGTRFYRAQTPLELCVPLISAKVSAVGAQNGLVRAGDAFEYRIDLKNDGKAAKDVPVSLLLPAGVSPDGALPGGFSARERTVCGVIHAAAGAGAVISLPLRVEHDALEGDKDALRLLGGALDVGGERIALPSLRAVGPMIRASLTPERENLEQGDATSLVITLVNTGLAPADVALSCFLPEGLTLLEQHDAGKDAPSASPDGADEQSEAGGALPAAAAQEGALRMRVQMDAAAETDAGVKAASREIALRVRADAPLEDVSERLLGAALSWQVGGSDTQLGEAAVVRIYRGGFLGMNASQWNGVLLASLLLLVTVCCLCSAVRSDKREEDICFE